MLRGEIEAFRVERVLERDDQVVRQGAEPIPKLTAIGGPRAIAFETRDCAAHTQRVSRKEPLEIVERVAMFGRRGSRGGRDWLRPVAHLGGEIELMLEALSNLPDRLRQPVEILRAIPIAAPRARRLDEEELRRLQTRDERGRVEHVMKRIEHHHEIDGVAGR